MDSIVQLIADSLTGILPPYVIVAIISMIPVLELRGSILVALPILHTKVLLTYIVAVIANMIPIPFIILFIDKIFDFLKRFKTSGRLVRKLEEKTLAKSDQINKYGIWGLFLFVAIPLPGTGAWTGTLAASLLDMDFKSSVAAVMCGVLLAGIIMGAAGAGLFGAIGALFG